MKLSEDRESTSIYLEQIQNHINVGEGYDRVRVLLFKELHMMDGNHPSVDDKLAQSIVIKLSDSLSNSVNFHQSEKTYRTLQIIADLLTYAEDIITPAMHNNQFLTSLTEAAKPKLVTFNSTIDSLSRNSALQIIAYWFQKYVRQQNASNELFIQAYKYLKEDKKCSFPSTLRIKPMDTYKPKSKPPSGQPQQPSSSTVILEDIAEFTIKTEDSLKKSIKNIATTEYVRLIKHKSKILFEFTQKGADLTDKQKSQVKDLYKRLRMALKDVDKYNQGKIQSQASISHEQEYIVQKITPKKKEKSSEPMSSQKKVSEKKEEIKIVEVDLLASPEEKTVVKENPGGQVKIVSKVQTNLLDMNFGGDVQPQTPPKQVKSQNLTNFADLLGEGPPNPSPTKLSNDQEQEFIEGVLIDNNISQQPKLSPQEKSMKDLQQVFSTPSRKQVSAEEESDKLAKQESNCSKGSSPSFDNDKKKDKYSYIEEVNLSPNSSNEGDDMEEKKTGLGLKFNLFGIFGSKENDNKGKESLFDEHKTYDDVPIVLQNIYPKEEIKLTPQTIPDLFQNNSQPSIKVPPKPIKAVDYSKYALQTSPQEEGKEDEGFALEQNKPFSELQEAEIESPRKASAKGNLVQEEGDG